jgi:hypothetical protein
MTNPRYSKWRQVAVEIMTLESIDGLTFSALDDDLQLSGTVHLHLHSLSSSLTTHTLSLVICPLILPRRDPSGDVRGGAQMVFFNRLQLPTRRKRAQSGETG